MKTFKEVLEGVDDLSTLVSKFKDIAKKTPSYKEASGHISTALNDTFFNDYKSNYGKMHELIKQIAKIDKNFANKLWKQYRDEPDPIIASDQKRADWIKQAEANYKKAVNSISKIKVNWKNITGVLKDPSVENAAKFLDEYINVVYLKKAIQSSTINRDELYTKFIIEPINKEVKIKYKSNEVSMMIQQLNNGLFNNTYVLDQYVKTKEQFYLNEFEKSVKNYLK